MPRVYQLTPTALDDLDEIWNYIAQDSSEAADRVESAIFAECESIARNPLIGSKRSEITPLPVRFWVVTRFPSFVVVYRPDSDPIQVVAILHAKRDLPRIIGHRSGA
jgi:plasmid stabilization system protein ParE